MYNYYDSIGNAREEFQVFLLFRSRDITIYKTNILTCVIRSERWTFWYAQVILRVYYNMQMPVYVIVDENDVRVIHINIPNIHTIISLLLFTLKFHKEFSHPQIFIHYEGMITHPYGSIYIFLSQGIC